MFNAALIVFRETLEAALIIGIAAAAATRAIPRRGVGIASGVALGLTGATVVASLAQQLGRWANGMGNELFNALVLAVAVAMLAGHNIWMASHGKQLAAQAREMGASVLRGELAMSAITVVIALTVLRKGAETVLFLCGIFAGSKPSAALMFGGLMRIPVRHFFSVTGWLMLFVTAGMAAQLAQILVQADVLAPIVQPLWDASRWVPAESGLGTLLRALVGYDPQPSATQVAFAGVVLVGVLIATRFARRG